MSGDTPPLPFYALAECTRTTLPLTIHSKIACKMHWILNGGLAVCYCGTDSDRSEERNCKAEPLLHGIQTI